MQKNEERENSSRELLNPSEEGTGTAQDTPYPSGPQGEPARAVLKLPFVRKLLLFRAAMILVSAGLAFIAVTTMTKSTQNAYQTAKEAQSQSAYDWFYQQSFEAAEIEHHVSNNVTVSIASIQTVDKLEVMRAGDVEYVILDEGDNQENVTSWLEVPGTGVFTVDLTLGEYTIDEQRKYVYIRVPRPALSEFAVDYANIKQLFWKDDIFNGSVKAGEELVHEQIQEASLHLKQYMTSDRMMYESATSAAKFMIANLVKQFNPDIPELTVEVAFIDEL